MIGAKNSCGGIIHDLDFRFGSELTYKFSSQQLFTHHSFENFLFAVLVSLIFSSYVFTQPVDLLFENIPIEEGTPTSIQYIYQDKIGYLWFATWSGLYKYDGYNFTSYKNDVEDTTSLFDNTLSTVYEDKEGIIWIGSRLGLERFDPKSETFIHYTPNPLDTGDNKSNQIWAINEDKNGMILIGTGNGMYNFDKASKKFTSIKFAGANLSDTIQYTIHAFYADKKGSLWVGTDKGLHRFDLETAHFDTTVEFIPEKLNKYHSEHGKLLKFWNFTSTGYPQEVSGVNEQINSILGDEDGIIWLGTNEGLVEFNPQTGTYTNYLFNFTLPVNRNTAICKDVITGSIWLATIDGLYSFDKKLKKFTHYNSTANCVYSERSRTFWIATNTDIKKLNRTRQPFRKYTIGEATHATINGRDGVVWVLTFKQWLKFDTYKDKFVPYSFGKDFLWYVWPPIGGYMSIRGEKTGLRVLDTLGNVIFSLDPSYYDYINSLSIGCNTKDEFWVGSENGDVDLWDHKTNRVVGVKNFKRRISWVYKDSFGLLWIPCFKGNLYCYNRDGDKYIEFFYNPGSPISLSGNIVNEMYEDSKGRLWFGTNNGLNRFDRSTNTFTYFGEKNGFPTNGIHGILEDDHGYLWILTTKGITKFNPEKNNLRNYDASYGLEPSADVVTGTGCKTRNGEMFFPGAKGFTRFHPDRIRDNPFIPPIVITSFKKFDEPIPFSNLSRLGQSKSGEIHLPYDENFLSFEFAALSYLSNERNQYAYMMEGLDKDWVLSGTRRFASYPNLDPGEYVFRVKGSNNDGVWNEVGTSISIIISPPWWKTTWAYILYSLLILSIIYTTWKMQVKRIRISHEYEMTKFEAEKLHEVDEIKSRFFANISHEFRTPLTLIIGPVKQIIERTKEDRTRDDLKVVHKNANRLLGLVNQLLDISKLESGKMKLQATKRNIVSLLKSLTMSFTSYAERKRITLKFNSSENEIIAYIDKDKIEKIIINVLSNAFKFTPEGGRIEVTIKCQAELVSASSLKQEIPKPTQIPKQACLTARQVRDDFKSVRNDKFNYVEIKITDTGVGIPKEKLPKIFDRFYQVDGSHTREQEGTGIGLALTKELVELHKGTIEVESEAGRGTTVTISIPYGKKHLKPEEIVELDKEKTCQPLADEDKEYDKEKEKTRQLFDEEERDYDKEIDVIKNLLDNEKKMEEHRIDLDVFENDELPLLLLVEDNADVRKYIRGNLNKDYRILEAVDGEDGWNKALESTLGGPDLIVSDVMMPKMDGFKLCKKLKADERTSHIPIILLTAKAASSDKIEGYEIGADDYIMKPFEPNELKARIKNLIEQRKRIHEHFKKHGLFEIEEKNITAIDQKILQQTIAIIEEHISDTSLSLETLTESLALSRSVLHRKIFSLLGETPGELIRSIRMKKAANLIEHHFGNLSEIALEVGFNNPAYFSECFKKEFGILPSQYSSKS